MEYNVTPYKNLRYLKWNTEAHHDAKTKQNTIIDNIQNICPKGGQIHGLQP